MSPHAPDPRYPRNLRGYGRNPPDPRWPDPSGTGSAKICVQFVVNYEEGGENSILHGDAASEAFLSEIVGAAPWPGQRHMNMESIYEYGARAGFWRLWRLFTERNLPVTVYGVATALERNPEAVEAMQEAGWEIASHGLKWIEYKDASAEHERAHMAEAIALHAAITGTRPLGWYTGRSSQHTLDLVAEEGGFLYASDAYADDLPYWRETPHGPLLILPYTLDSNDMRFATAGGFNSGDQFFAYLRDAFDVLHAEGEAGSAKMLSIGLHCRLVGRPGRVAALARFLDHIASRPGVWIARRIDIARHWRKTHPHAPGLRPSRMSREAFLAAFGGVFEHSPFVASRAFDKGLHEAHDSPAGLSGAMNIAFRQASAEERLGVLKAHPDLAGRLALAGGLTAESRAEQASAGLDRLTGRDLSRFTELNRAYVARFGFPFVVAVRGRTVPEIMEAFEGRMANAREAEIAAAAREVERIARLRIENPLPRTCRLSERFVTAEPLPEAAVLLTRLIDLAHPRLGTEVVFATDDFFADKSRLIDPDVPVFYPERFDENGKWMDGWESRRKRGPGHDWCVIRLGQRGRIEAVDVDTAFFTGNFPPEAGIEAADTAGEPGEGDWRPLVPRSALKGDGHNLFQTDASAPWRWLRLHIHPDGGVARLRVYGTIETDWSAVPDGEVVDLAALVAGGTALAWNDAHYGHPANMLAPGRAAVMKDGWETARRRRPGNDWCVLRLGHPGTIERIHIDTRHFKGNYPDRFTLRAARLAGALAPEAAGAASAAWPLLQGETKLAADAIAEFDAAPLGPVSHVRLDIFPDGGVSRLRLFGRKAAM